MARIRTIKPEFWTDDKITELSIPARLFFIGCWNFADDKGNLDRSARQLKLMIFPGDNLDVEQLIDELIATGLLIEYQVEGKHYLNIKNFLRHQKIDHPSKTNRPTLDEDDEIPI